MSWRPSSGLFSLRFLSSLMPSPLAIEMPSLAPALPWAQELAQPPLTPIHIGHVQAWAPCVLVPCGGGAARCGSFEDAG